MPAIRECLTSQMKTRFGSTYSFCDFTHFPPLSPRITDHPPVVSDAAVCFMLRKRERDCGSRQCGGRARSSVGVRREEATCIWRPYMDVLMLFTQLVHMSILLLGRVALLYKHH